MKRVIVAFIFVLLFVPSLVRADMGRHYALQKNSAYQDGCFAPCMCPMLVQAPLRGKFSLIPIGTENGYDVFAVMDAQWLVTLWDGSTVLARGSGTYRSSTAYRLQRLEMDLLVADRPLEHYDSGLVPIRVPLPQINVTISMNGQYCHDTVFTLDAGPTPNDVRPPRLQFDDEDEGKGATTTWGRLKKLWTP